LWSHSATSLEIRPQRELALDKDGESAEDDEILAFAADYSVNFFRR
jgi:hypothetical protein